MKLKKVFLLITTLLGIVLTLTACSTKREANTKNHKVDIVTSTNIYANIARNIVGKHGEVQAIITNGDTDPHDFEPTTNSAKEVANANIVIANGLGYDDWMTKLADSNDIHVTKVGEQLMGLKQGDNPHIWYNLDMPKRYVNYIVKRASQIDPKNAAYFRKKWPKLFKENSEYQGACC